MQLRDKLKLKEQTNPMIELTAFFPASQGVILTTHGEDHFRVNINGHEIIMSKGTLSVLFEKIEVKTVSFKDYTSAIPKQVIEAPVEEVIVEKKPKAVKAKKK